MPHSFLLLLLWSCCASFVQAQDHTAQDIEQAVLRSLGPSPDSAAFYLERLRELASAGAVPEAEVRLGYLEAALTDRTGRNVEALKLIHKTDSLPVQDKALASQVKNMKGRILFANDEHDAAMGAYLEALQLTAPTDTMRIAVIYNNLSRVYERLKNYPKAIEALEKSIALHEARKDGPRAAGSLLNLGVVLFAQKRFAEAEERVSRALTYAQAEGMDDVVGIGLETLGNIQRKTGRYDAAMRSYQEALRITERSQSLDGMASINRNIGELHLDADRPSHALPHFGLCLTLADSMDSRNYRQDAHYYLSEAHDRLKDHEQALHHLRMYIAVRDSVLSDERNAAVAAWQVRFEMAEKERIILEQRMRGEADRQALRQREQQLAAMGGGIVLAFAFLLLLWRDRQRGRKLSGARIAALQQEQRIMAMRSMLAGEEKERQRVAAELHDGLGVLLSAARMRLGSAGGQEKASDLLKDATAEVRRISHALMPGSLSKLGLPEALRELASALSSDGLTIHVHEHGLQERLPPELETGLYRIAQEAINNAIRHGDAHRVDIELSRENEDRLSMVIVDDGSGFEVITIGGDGSGMNNIRTRAAMLGGSARVEAHVGKGTTWEIDLPLRTPITT